MVDRDKAAYAIGWNDRISHHPRMNLYDTIADPHLCARYNEGYDAASQAMRSLKQYEKTRRGIQRNSVIQGNKLHIAADNARRETNKRGG